MKKIILFLIFSSLSYAKSIAFLSFEDKTPEGKGKEHLELIISQLFPSERFNLIPEREVNKVLTPKIQRELGTITKEIAWTLGELLGCDVIAIGSIEGSSLKRMVRFFFIETRRKTDPNLTDHILSLFLSHFGLNTKIEKLISQEEIVISLGKEDGIRTGDRFDCIRDGKKIAECEVISCEPSRSYLSLLYAKEKISPFDIIRKSTHEISKTKEFLIVNTKPRAFVLWRGRNMGESPIILNDKIEGGLSISKEGYKPCKIEIEDKSYPNTFLSLSLFLTTLEREEKMPPSLAVSSLPTNCEVFLDGRFVGLTPLFIPNLEEKVYEVVVKKEGFREVKQKVLLKQDQELKVNLYSLSLPEEKLIPKEKEYLSELVSLQTSHCLKNGGLKFGFFYPELFILKASPPSSLKTEIRVFGIGGGLKYNIIDWLGIDLYYKAYNMEKKEKEKEKGFWLIGSLPSKFFNIHLGLGKNWMENSNKGQYFIGMDMPIKWFNLMAEYEKDRLRIGIHKAYKGFEIKTGIGRGNKETLYNFGIYICQKP